MWKLLFLIAASIAPFGDSIKCIVGYGQRGLSYSNGISWERDCPNTKYCFEVVTNKMNNVARLFDYPWVILNIVMNISIFSYGCES